MRREDFMKMVATGAITPVISAFAYSNTTSSKKSGEESTLKIAKSSNTLPPISLPDDVFPSIAQLIASDIVQSQNIEYVTVLGYYKPGDGGGGNFYWDADEDKQDHNGGSIIDPNHSGNIASNSWYSPANRGSGCWKRQLNNFIIPEFFGAKGNGIDKDTEAFQAMLSNHSNIYLINHYLLDRISGNLSRYNITGGSGSILDFSQAKDTSYNSFCDFLLAGKKTPIVKLSKDLNKDDTTLAFKDNHGLSNGDVFFIKNETEGSWSGYRPYYKKGEMGKVKNVISATEIMLESGLYDNYKASEVDVYKLETLTANLSNFNIIGGGYKGVKIRYGEDITVENLKFTGGFIHTLDVVTCYGGLVNQISVDHTKDSGKFNYGILYSSSQNLNIQNCNLNTIGDSIESSGGITDNFPTREVMISGCYASNGISSHGSSEFIRFNNCVTSHIVISGNHGEVHYCKARKFIRLREIKGYDFTFTNNEIGNKTQVESPVFKMNLDEKNVQYGGDFIFSDNNMHGEFAFKLGYESDLVINAYICNNIIKSTQDKNANVRISTGNKPFNQIVLKNNIIQSRLDEDPKSPTLAYYPDNALEINDIAVKDLYLNDNIIYGRLDVRFQTASGTVFANITGNKIMRSAKEFRISGNNNCLVTFEGNKYIQNLNQQNKNQRKGQFEKISALYIQSNFLGNMEDKSNANLLQLTNVDKIVGDIQPPSLKEKNK